MVRHGAERRQLRRRVCSESSFLPKNREKNGVAGGDEVDVDIELDTEPREVTVPADFAKALKGNAVARKRFDGLSHSRKQSFVVGIEGAKTEETRERRIRKAMNELSETGTGKSGNKP